VRTTLVVAQAFASPVQTITFTRTGELP